jgi:hypothetical protein
MPSKRALSRSSTFLLAVAILGLALVLVAGCGGSSSQRVPVSGTVQFNGKPVTNGGISFIGRDKDTISTNGPITDGKYELTAQDGPTPGKYQVQISWLKKTGRKINLTENRDPEYTQDETIEQIPAKYNNNTTLEVEIKSGTNTHDFNLTR